MKYFNLILCLFSFFLSSPAHSSEIFTIDFANGKSVLRGELVNLREMIEYRAPGYAGQRITGVKVYAEPRTLNSDGYVQLLDENRRLISEDSLSNRYTTLQVFRNHQRASYLHFENDVYLHRVEIVTESLKPLGVLPTGQTLEIGSFIKTDYKPDVKKFSLPRGGFSKINFRVHVGEEHAVIVNSILVLSNGRKLSWKTVGARLINGDNQFSLDVPKDATDIQVSFAHGQGSSVQILLQP